MDQFLGQGIDTSQPADASVTATKLANPLDLPDDHKIRFGTGNDLEIYHENTGQTYIQNKTGNFRIDACKCLTFKLHSG